jgi:hypothetical protein
MKYQVLEKQKNQFITLVLINEIINFQTYFPVKLEGDNTFINSYLGSMLTQGMLVIKNDKFVPTPKGREFLQNFYNKYYEYLKMFDLYCAVDLEKGEFAFSSLDKFDSDEEWFDFLSEERFSDVRVAVAEFKKMDPTEIVFMSFLNENRFDCTAPKWQYNLTGDDVWKEIEEILNTAVTAEYLTTDGVLEDVIKQGTQIAMGLIRIAESASNTDDNFDQETVTETTTTEEYVDVVNMPYYGYDYWDPYYDPFYISPLWLVPALILF